jgi:uncharacterized repeat protein (TIGR01451 family)
MNAYFSFTKSLQHIAAKAVATALLLVGTTGISSAWAQSCPASLPVAQTFTFSAAPTVFVVPNNVTRIRIIATGASGGTATNGGFLPGAGARAEGTYTVVSGQTVTAVVGAAGAGGDNESGGGGASGAYLGSTLAVVAGAGGGQDNTGNGGGGQTTTSASNGLNPTGGNCPDGGLGGTGGAGGQFGEVGTANQTCQTGNGGAGGGGLNSAGGSSAVLPAAPARFGPTGGAQCSIAGAAGGLAGTGGAPGGFGICGGGGADDRESGGGGGYSGGGGGPESGFPGGGGSFVSASAATPTLVVGANGGGAGANGQVVICYAVPVPTNLAISKTNATNTLAAGSTTSYTIVATNSGPGPSDGASLSDPVAAGLACTAVTCSATTGGASCPSPGGATIAILQSPSGIILPNLPANSSITFTVSCGVTASGT